jgi:hypothetical protein
MTDSISFAPNSPTFSAILSMIDQRESGRTICSTRLRRHGLRSGGTGVKQAAFARLNVMRGGYRWRSSANSRTIIADDPYFCAVMCKLHCRLMSCFDIRAAMRKLLSWLGRCDDGFLFLLE